MGERIAEAVGDGSRFGLEVDYVSDGPVLLGTGGALARALPTLGERFAIIYGDSWLDFDYRAAVAQFERDARPALMTVFRNEGRWDTSNVETERRDGARLQQDRTHAADDPYRLRLQPVQQGGLSGTCRWTGPPTSPRCLRVWLRVAY